MDRQAGTAEFEITPAMIEAGVFAFCEFEEGESLRTRVTEIFLAMWSELPLANRITN